MPDGITIIQKSFTPTNNTTAAPGPTALDQKYQAETNAPKTTPTTPPCQPRAAEAAEESLAETEDLGAGGSGWTTTETFIPLKQPPFPQMKKYLLALSRRMKSLPLLQFPVAPSVVQLSYPVWFTSNTLYCVFWYLNAAPQPH